MIQPPEKSDAHPLTGLDEWEDDLKRRYPEKKDSEAGKSQDQFRDYSSNTRPSVREFYRLNHQFQTFEYVQQMRAKYLSLERAEMSIWEAMEFLNRLVDDSDPDTELTQIEHLLQTAESIRADGHPRWFILTGLIHDLGKILCLFGEPQWAVVGDTFPVGCAFSDEIVFHEFFDANPDSHNTRYQTKHGVYDPNTGLDNVFLSWGHDEYLYHVIKDHLPEPALYMIRYHSFYPGHREGAYDHLMSDHDQEMFRWVRKFNPYDLYSKSDSRPEVDALKPFYLDLIDEFFPEKLRW